MDLSGLFFALGIIITALVGYLGTKKYVFQGFDQSHTISLLLFMIVLCCSVGILMMLVKYLIIMGS